jgi:hypothetical protein
MHPVVLVAVHDVRRSVTKGGEVGATCWMVASYPHGQGRERRPLSRATDRATVTHFSDRTPLMPAASRPRLARTVSVTRA